MKNDNNKIYTLNDFGEDIKVRVVFNQYANGGTAIILKSYDSEFDYWEDYSVASVFVEGYSNLLKDNKVFIKDYSENKGILNFLQKNGIVGPIQEILNNGFVDLYLVEIL